jgi:hypothetical protein
MSTETRQDQSVKVGDVFFAMWGYEQTNIDFVKVISISKTGKSVKAVSIGQKIIEKSGFMSETVAPDPENIKSKEVILRIDKRNQDNPELVLRGSYYYSGEEKQLQTLWRYERPLNQSHYA